MIPASLNTMLMGGESDPFYGSVSLLFVADPSGAIVDKSKYNHSLAITNVTTTDTQSILASGRSFNFNGGKIIAAKQSNEFDFASNDWTVEWWTRLPDVTNVMVEVLRSANTQGLILYNGGGQELCFWDAGNRISTTSSPPPNTWIHRAYVRQGNTCRFYRNGVQFPTTFNQVGSMTTTTNGNAVVGNQTMSSSYNLNGFMDGVRITNGVCRYPNGTTFTPPTTFPTQ